MENNFKQKYANILPSQREHASYFLLPWIRFNPITGQQNTVLIILIQTYDKVKQRYVYITTTYFRTLCSLPEYKNRFYGMSSQLFHPDFIMKNLMSEHIILNRQYSDSNVINNKSIYFYNLLQDRLN